MTEVDSARLKKSERLLFLHLFGNFLNLNNWLYDDMIKGYHVSMGYQGVFFKLLTNSASSKDKFWTKKPGCKPWASREQIDEYSVFWEIKINNYCSVEFDIVWKR